MKVFVKEEGGGGGEKMREGGGKGEERERKGRERERMSLCVYCTLSRLTTLYQENSLSGLTQYSAAHRIHWYQWRMQESRQGVLVIVHVHKAC